MKKKKNSYQNWTWREKGEHSLGSSRSYVDHIRCCKKSTASIKTAAVAAMSQCTTQITSLRDRKLEAMEAIL